MIICRVRREVELAQHVVRPHIEILPLHVFSGFTQICPVRVEAELPQHVVWLHMEIFPLRIFRIHGDLSSRS